MLSDFPHESMDVLVAASNAAKNSMSRIRGFSPAQWVLATQPRMPESLMIDDNDQDNVPLRNIPESEAEGWARIVRIRDAARQAFIMSDTDARLRRAMSGTSRPFRTTYVSGDFVYIARRTSAMSKDYTWLPGAATVVGPAGTGFYYVDYGGRFFKVTAEQMRPPSSSERAAREAVMHADLGLEIAYDQQDATQDTNAMDLGHDGGHPFVPTAQGGAAPAPGQPTAATAPRVHVPGTPRGPSPVRAEQEPAPPQAAQAPAPEFPRHGHRDRRRMPRADRPQPEQQQTTRPPTTPRMDTPVEFRIATPPPVEDPPSFEAPTWHGHGDILEFGDPASPLDDQDIEHVPELDAVVRPEPLTVCHSVGTSVNVPGTPIEAPAVRHSVGTSVNVPRTPDEFSPLDSSTAAAIAKSVRDDVPMSFLAPRTAQAAPAAPAAPASWQMVRSGRDARPETDPSETAPKSPRL